MVDIALPADWVGGYHNLAQLSSDMQSQLLDAVKKVTGKPSGLQEFLNRVKYPAYIRPLFKGGQLQTEKAKQYKSRLESLTPADIDTWKVALKNASGAESEAWSIAYGMVQIESLWEGDRLTDGTKKRSLARLASIPAASFGEWTDGAGGKEDTAVYLLQTEALFVNDRFDSELFGKAVPLAKQKYKERAEEHERASKAKAAKRQ